MINKYFKFQLLVFNILFLVSFTGLKAADWSVNIIPAQLSMKILKGGFSFHFKIRILVIPSNPEALPVATFFTKRLVSAGGLDIKPHTNEALKQFKKYNTL